MRKVHFKIAPFNQDCDSSFPSDVLSSFSHFARYLWLPFCLHLNRWRRTAHRCLCKAFYDLCFIHDLAVVEHPASVSPILSFPPSSPSFSLSPWGQRGPGPSPAAPLRVKWNFSDPCLHKELQLVTLLPPTPAAAGAAPQPVRAPVSGCRHHQRAHSKRSAQFETQTATL